MFLLVENKEVENQIITVPGKVYILPKINIDYYTKHGLFEKNLIQWCEQFCSPDKVFLDIGAHSGTYTIALAKLCKQVYAFEPQQTSYYALCGSVALSNLSNVTCINKGLGSIDQVGTQTLHIVSEDGGGSTLHSNDQKVLRTEKIKIKTLDSYNLKDVNFIKMDVEENELFVLLGAVETLNQWKPKLIFEMNQFNPKIKAFLELINYKLIHINGTANMYLATF